MGRIRTIKPEFFTSDDVSALPLRARLTWIGLWTHCDDYGRCRDNVKLIKAAVWPLDGVSIGDIGIDLNTLADRGLIIRYTIDSTSYLAVTKWEQHQASAYRRGAPKYPAPPEQPEYPCGSSANGVVVQKDASRTSSRASRTSSRAGTGNREQGTGNAREHFDAFWVAYPRRVGKEAARKAWLQAEKRGVDPTLILAAAGRYAKETAGQEPQYVAHPSTWLNAGRYDDEPAKPSPRLPTVHELEVPPDGLDERQYAVWEAEHRR